MECSRYEWLCVALVRVLASSKGRPGRDEALCTALGKHQRMIHGQTW